MRFFINVTSARSLSGRFVFTKRTNRLAIGKVFMPGCYSSSWDDIDDRDHDWQSSRSRQEFVQLTTSQGRPNLSETSILLKVYDYLEHVRTGLAGKPLCPFVEAVHRHDGYHITVYEQPTPQVDFTLVAAEMRAAFARISPTQTHAEQPLDISVVVAAFAGNGYRESIFGTRLEAARDSHRQSFLNQGLMLSQMYEKHADPKRNRGYASRIPLLIVRRMHRPDIVFMKSPQEIAAYQKFFG